MPDDDPFWLRASLWAWTNLDKIEERLNRVSKWLGYGRTPSPVIDAEQRPGILLIGPGGTGKTTLAKLLSGESLTRILEEPWKYEESITEERYALLDDPNVEVVVPPGQPHRREATWTDLRAIWEQENSEALFW